MATVVCISVPNIPNALNITLPGVGELQFIKDTIDGIPRPSTYVLKALNALSPSLAPLYTIIRVLDVIISLVGCIKAIPKALPANPSPIINCIKNLVKAFANLVPLLPPLSYVRMIADILAALRVLIDDMLTVLTQIDAQVSRIKELFARALQGNGDPVLFQIGQCAQNDLKQSTAGFLQIMQLITKIITIMTAILEIMAEVIPGPLGDKIGETLASMQAASDSFEDVDPVSEYPPLQNIKTSLLLIRNVLNALESFCRGVIGMSFTLSMPELPTINNP
jgi:hypothetical protein